MTKRYLYSLLFAIPGLFFSLLISFAVFAAAAGVLWIYAFGDEPWPSSAGTALPLLFALVLLTVWGAVIAAGFVVGKRLEKDPVLNKKHVLISAGMTIASLLLIVLHQFSVGNLGPKSDSLLCSEFCAQKGYPGSGLPPRDSGDTTCSCFDDSGRVIIMVPVESIGR